MAAAKSDESGDFNDLVDRLVGVDLLHLDDLAAAAPNDWVQQTFYTVINDRYQENRSIVFTADVQNPLDLRRYLGNRVFSRLMEMCGEPIQMFGEDHRLRAMG
jgi:DNA replication protein DnaC